MSTNLNDNPPQYQTALSRAVAALLEARSPDDVYEALLRATASEFEISGCKVIHWSYDAAPPEVVWRGQTAGFDGGDFAIPPKWTEHPRSIKTVEFAAPEDSLSDSPGGGSLVAAPMDLPLNASFHLIVFRTAARITDSDHGLARLLDTLSSVASLTLANLANHFEKEQDRQALNEAVESVPLGVLAVAADKRILICNRNTEFIFGLRRIEILGKNYAAVLPRVLTEAMDDLIRSISRWEDTFDREFTYAIDPRTTLRIGISVVPMMDNQDKIFGYVFILRDMTLTREAQTLRELSLLNLEFIQTVSHEIKAPLMAVLMGADYLMARGTNFDLEQRETLQTIDQGAQRLQELVADLLDLVNFESGHVSLDLEFGDLGALAARVARVFRTLPNIDISLEIDAALKPFRFDHRKIHRVLENLVSNAIKYSGKEACVKIEIAREDDLVRVSVSDRGIGIPHEHLPYIWDKFYRVSSPDTEKTPGSGLGLALAKQIITMHRGRIAVQSEVNKGSTFSLTLPMGGPP